MSWTGVRLMMGASLVLALGSIGCGDDDDGMPADGGADTDASSAGGGKGGAGKGGSGGSGGSSGSTSTGGSSGTGTTAGTGGVPGFPMGAACDSSIPTTATCGGMTCSGATGPLASFVCSVPCCLPDDTCGRRRAFMTDATACAAPAQPDPDCPDLMTAGFGMGMAPMDGGTGGMVMEGCCAPSKLCGVISGADGSCITSSALLPNLMPGAPCGDDDMDGGSE